MICKIADLTVSVPPVGNMEQRSENYKINLSEGEKCDIIIDEGDLNISRWRELSVNSAYYLETSAQFYYKLLDFDGIMLHSSAVVKDGKAYLFSGPSGIGKSTHTRMWLEAFKGDAVIINDDKPALRLIDGKWYAYGTPWCGKDGINVNMRAEVAGICFLRRGTERNFRRLEKNSDETLRYCLSQMARSKRPVMMTKLITLADRLINDVPIYEFYNAAGKDDALVTYEGMKID